MAQMAFALAISVAIALISSSLRPGPPQPNIGDLYITSSAFGDPIPITYGTTRVSGKLIWASGAKRYVKGRSKQGKKGSRKGGKGHGKDGPGTFYADIAFALCEGPIESILTVWANSSVIFDATGEHSDANGTPIGIGKYITRFYYGTEDQMPDPLIQSITDGQQGAGSTPAYRGTAYIVFESMDLTAFGNMIPSINAQVTSKSADTLPTVPITALTTEAFPGSAGVGPGGRSLMDWTTETMYVCNGNGISVWDVGSGSEEVRQYSYADMGFDLAAGGGYAGYGVQAWAIIPNKHIVAITEDIYGHPIYHKIDVHSMRYVYGSGIVTSGTSNPVKAYGIPVAYGAVGDFTYVMTINLFGVPSIYCVTNPTIFSMTGAASGVVWTMPSGFLSVDDTVNSGALMLAVCDIPKETETSIYFFPGAVAQYKDFNIYKATVSPGGTTNASKVGTISAADLGVTSGNWRITTAEYDLSDGGLIFTTVGYTGTPGPSITFKWHPFVGLMWVRHDLPYFNYVDYTNGTESSIVYGGRIGLWSNNSVYGCVLDTASGRTIWDTTNVSALAATNGGLPVAWDGRNSCIIVKQYGTSQLAKVYMNRSGNSGTTLQKVVEDICYRVGLRPEDVDASALTEHVNGFVVSRRVEAKAALSQLASLYFFDVVETDNVLRFVHRGANPVVAITQDDLGQTRNSKGKLTNDDNYWKHTKKQEIELPAEVHVRTFDPARNLQYGDQSARRVLNPVASMSTKVIATVEAAVVVTADEAAQMAQKLLFTSWLERDSYETSLGSKWLYLDPTDVVSVSMNNGDVYTARVTKAITGADLSMSMTFSAEDNVTYTSTATGSSGYNLIPTGFSMITTPTSLILLDLPLIADTHDQGSYTSFVYYGGFSPASANWPGATVLRSVDQTNFALDNAISSEPFVGTMGATLPHTNSPHFIDNLLSIQVFPYRGILSTLASTTMDGLLSGANMAVVGQEIIQFMNANLNADGSYTLTGILRGCRGTDWFCNLHTVGENFIMLDTDALQFDTYATSFIGQSWLYRAVTFGAFLDTGVSSAVSLTGAALKPYPVNAIARAPSGGDLAVTWTRRTRLGGGLFDGTGTVPLAEESEVYEAYILSAPFVYATFDPTKSSTYVRAFTGLTSPALTYTSAQMTADGFTPSTDTLHIVVYQRSVAAGRGFPSAANLPPA